MNCEHDFVNAKRFGRADWRCQLCGENVFMVMLFLYEAGVNVFEEGTESEIKIRLSKMWSKRRKKWL